MDRFFKNVQRMNSLLPLLALLVVFGAFIWVNFKNHEKPTASVQVPNDSGESKMFYFLNTGEHLEKNGVWILRLGASDEKGWHYEDRRSRTRNLLLIPGNRQEARWLFKDQTQRIHHVEKLPEAEGAFVKAIYIEAAPISKMDSPDADEDNLTIFLAKPNGDKPVAILSKIDKVIGRHLAGDVLDIIYQQGMSVRKAQISIVDFKVQSDQEVAKMMAVPL